MQHPETVTIDTEHGPVIINKADFDEKKHTLAGTQKPAAKKTAPKKR